MILILDSPDNPLPQLPHHFFTSKAKRLRMKMAELIKYSVFEIIK
ncbi:hypothetical protein XCR1_870036 [Xenorhabdus cabanillasii JM26]|uniref:Uncharacterized protein n=1 Tax=Xenorhabdus cabanillasii JM26 TaxID=1427517 RepID=W1JBK0_9GAMM|nr:hypothetical protein XCR1_870036 [Xenorhabdus cabanillasii JM26]